MKEKIAPKNIVSLTIVAAILFSLTAFTSCGLMDKLGFDTYDYMSEKVTRTYAVDSDVAATLEDLLMILITDSLQLSTFENTADAIREYRDAVLGYMLDEGYAKYSGNTALIEKAADQYPEYQITQVIPESEFEATMYRYFGGDVKITHRDGNRFKYLSGVGVYISMIASSGNGLYADITSLEETEQTYRVKFKVKSAETAASSEEYFALIIKRDDGTLYIKKLIIQ